jgi:hypothetical protein
VVQIGGRLLVRPDRCGMLPPAVMSMIIEISSELEPTLKAQADKAGVDPIVYIHQLLRACLSAGNHHGPSVSPEETQLLNKINQGLSAEDLDLYRKLIRKRQLETITDEEFQHLDRLTRRLESLQARRMAHLAALAQLRQVSLADLMARLEIQPPDVL